MFKKRVSQSERRIRNSHVTSMHYCTGTPLVYYAEGGRGRVAMGRVAEVF